MKKRVVLSMGAVLSLCLLSGCIESATVLQVKKDGSGAILLREFLSAEALSMMNGMEAMAGHMAVEHGEDVAHVEGLSDLSVLFQGMVLARASEFGNTVRLTEVREVTNDQGWKGYMARFEFDDVNVVRLASSMSPEDDEGGSDAAYSVSFTPGDTAELRLIPHRAATSSAMDPGAGMSGMEDADMDWPDTMSDDIPDFGAMDMGDLDFGDMLQGMDDAMSAMFGNMFKGMRMSLYVDVEGEIVDTDARHRSETRPNRVALVDMNMDEVMTHPEALSQLMTNDPEAIYSLQEDGAPGLLMEAPDKTVTIRFR